MSGSIQLEKIGAAPTLPGFSLAASAAAGDQSLLFLFERDHDGIGSLPRSGKDGPKQLRLLVERAGSAQWIDLPPLAIAYPKVDIFPDGRILLAATRCNWRSETDYDLNGIIFDPRTGQMSRILLGDAVGELQIDGRGRIWAAYYDEGIFGNCGWGHPGPAPVGRAGLICFSALGEKVWEFPRDAAHVIDDCYALNVSGADVAIFFYPDFPICRIGVDFQLGWRRTELLGCHAFAMSATEILFSSQYEESSETAHLGRVAADEIVDVRKVRLLMPDGSVRPPGRVQGRGPHLYHFGDDGIYRTTLS